MLPYRLCGTYLLNYTLMLQIAISRYSTQLILCFMHFTGIKLLKKLTLLVQ